MWPNDILVGGRKVAGILCEMSADQERVAWAVAGVGVNVRSAPALEDARWEAGALGDLGDPPARADLLVDLLSALGRRYAQWVGGDAAGVLDAFAGRDALAGSADHRRAGGGGDHRALRRHRRPGAPAPAHAGGRAPAGRRRGRAGRPL